MIAHEMCQRDPRGTAELPTNVAGGHIPGLSASLAATVLDFLLSHPSPELIGAFTTDDAALGSAGNLSPGFRLTSASF